jgi:hypothetical protein
LIINAVAVADVETLRAQYRQIACWTNLGNTESGLLTARL